MRIRTRLVAIATLAAALQLTGGASTLTQEDVASAIVDTPAQGFVLLVSNRVDVSTLDPKGSAQVADAWVKSFSNGADAISIVATQFTDRAALRAGLAGALSQIDPEDRRLDDDHAGVVRGIAAQDAAAVTAIYGEGTISFVIAALGPSREEVLAEALAAQIDHSTGERFDLHVDESERFLAETGSSGVVLWIALIVSAVALLTLAAHLIRRIRRGAARR